MKHITTFESFLSESAFHAALAKAKEEGLEEFEFQGKTYPVKKEALKEGTIKTFESFVNEGNQSMGNLAKKMTTPGTTGVGEWDTFVEAVEKEKDNGEDLPKEWYDALKTLKIKAEEAAVIFFDAVGSQDDVEYKANRLNLKYVVVEGGEDGGSAGIVFSTKQ